MFARLGRWCFHNRGKVALLWLAALILGGAASSVIGTAYNTQFSLPDVESRRGFDILDRYFADSGAGGEGGTIVFR
ncbi:MAG: MMPL family transporter, partial [Actinomycetota bacterium]